jgi:hypothetical protein
MLTRLWAGLALLAMAAPAIAADVTITPTADKLQMQRQWQQAKCGDNVTLAAGAYDVINVPRFDCPQDSVMVDASAAKVTNLVFQYVKGVNWYGGTVNGIGGPRTAAVTIDFSQYVKVAGLNVTGSVGITVVRSTDVRVEHNYINGVLIDGMTTTMASRVVFDGNTVIGSVPTRAIYDAAGKLVVDGTHADCAQYWTTYGKQPTTDIIFRNNYCRGEMQGIVSFDVGPGGPKRILVENNIIDGLWYWNGIVAYQAEDSTFRNNIVRTKRGVKAFNFPFQAIKTWIYLKTPINSIACGNIVEAMPNGEGTKPCPSQDAKLVNVMPATRK